MARRGPPAPVRRSVSYHRKKESGGDQSLSSPHRRLQKEKAGPSSSTASTNTETCYSKKGGRNVCSLGEGMARRTCHQSRKRCLPGASLDGSRIHRPCRRGIASQRLARPIGALEPRAATAARGAHEPVRYACIGKILPPTPCARMPFTVQFYCNTRAWHAQQSRLSTAVARLLVPDRHHLGLCDCQVAEFIIGGGA